MDGSEPDRWSAVAADWAELWAGVAQPAWAAIVSAAGVGSGTRMLDVGCGSGDFLAYAAGLGAVAAGIDPAPGMVALARSRLPGFDIRLGSADRLPWPDAAFDVVTAVNSFQFAENALSELARVTVPGGAVAIAIWAESARNDLDRIEIAVAAAAEEEVPPNSPLRQPGGLRKVLESGGLHVLASGLVTVTWEAADDQTLVRGVLLGETPDRMASAGPAVIDAARPFRTDGGGYRLVNAFRYAVGRTTGLPSGRRGFHPMGT
jgi:SAM-dependent methyltransferase